MNDVLHDFRCKWSWPVDTILAFAHNRGKARETVGVLDALADIRNGANLLSVYLCLWKRHHRSLPLYPVRFTSKQSIEGSFCMLPSRCTARSPVRFSNPNFVYISCFHERYITLSSVTFWFYHPSNVKWRLQIMELFIMWMPLFVYLPVSWYSLLKKIPTSRASQFEKLFACGISGYLH